MFNSVNDIPKYIHEKMESLVADGKTKATLFAAVDSIAIGADVWLDNSGVLTTEPYNYLPIGKYAGDGIVVSAL